MVDLLPLVLALPLGGVVVLVLGGRRLSARVAAALGTGAVGAAFVLALGIAASFAAQHASDDAEGPAPTEEVRLWTWMSVGENLVEVTVALTDLPALEPVAAGSVGQVWMPSDQPGVARLLQNMWDAGKVVGERPIAAAVPRHSALTVYNVPPGTNAFTRAVPRTQHRFASDVVLQLDGLSLVMLLVVTGVGFLIHLFAMGYMAGDPDVPRFFTYMNLFVFGMLVLVLAGDFLLLFVGWEMVGLCSYLLIGFWHADPANADAGRKAFLVNRVGDFAFLVGLMLLWSVFGSLAYRDVLPAAGVLLPAGSGLAVAITALLLAGATGKSAQIPLFVWLPDAMAGPTPVSALIHAATMVTAGVYMITRAHALFERAPQVMAAVAIIGASTALVAAVIAVVQVDIKRVLAYSTISQLGYMFLAVGAGAYVAGIFHLVTHAFFKALLFLAAGSAMHALQHGFHHAGAHPAAIDGVPPDQDMRQMGGLLGRIPVTGWTFLIGALALAGVFPLAGFWSKDEILLAVLGRDRGAFGLWTALYVVALFVAFLTALYTGRQLLLVLGGTPRSEGARRAAESPALMTVPLAALAALTVLGGGLGVGLGGRPLLPSVLEPVVGTHAASGADKVALALVATGVAVLGLALAWLAYGPRRVIDPARVAGAVPWAYRLARRKLYVDEIYLALFVRPYERLAAVLWHVVDDRVIDGTVNATGRVSLALGQRARRWQTGYPRTYLLSMLLGVVVIAVWLVLRAR
jgi:NADH-quinone oxidoreductase subunit L